jgi:uncharacterized membrane protein
MYVTGRWVSTNVVGTMFIAWLVGVVIFAAVLVWQLRKHRKGNSTGDRRRGSTRPSGSKKAKRRRRGIR